ncbi:MAG: AAA family ATPase [Desulfurococcaceae archaeon]
MLTEKYRPQRLDEIVGQDEVISRIKNLKDLPRPPHMLFIGPSGCGKTSTAYAFAKETNRPVVELNASDERGIATIRERVKRLAFSAGERIILLDEVDNMTPDAQHALRRIMEKAAEGVVFILTGNSEWKIIDPIKSRCAIFRFKKLDERTSAQVLIRILKMENVNVTPEVTRALVKLIKVTDGDLRLMLNELETIISKNGTISEEDVELLVRPNLALQSLEAVLDIGDWELALRRLEDAIVASSSNVDEVVNTFYKSIGKLNAPLLVKLRMYDRLSYAELAIKTGCDPVIQLAGFLADVWAYVYSQKKRD